MSGGGEGDRPGVVPSGINGDRRPPRKPFRGAIRRVDAQLFDLEGILIAHVGMVIGAELPEIVMYEGDPFLRVRGDARSYAQVKPYRADALVIEVLK